MDSKLSRESCGHAPLEILRQDALQGRWSEAMRTCYTLGLSDCLDLDVLWAVWAQDADAVGAAVAKAERKRQEIARSPPSSCSRRTAS